MNFEYIELISGEEGDDSRDGLIEDNPEKGRRKFLIEELNNKDIDSSDVDITAMLDEIEEDMDLDELVRQKALLQEKLKKDGIDGISDEELEEKDEGERARDNEEREDNGDRDGAENDNDGGAIDLEKPELVEIKSDSDDSDVEHLITLDRKREKKDRRSDSGRRESRKDPKDLLKDRWGKRGDSREKERESRDRDRGSRDRGRDERSSRRRSSRSREREIKERQKERELRHKAAEEKRGAGDLRDEQRRREGGRGERGRDDRSSRRRSRSRDKDRDKDRSDRRDNERGEGAQEESSDENLDIEINSEDSDEEAIIERKRKERAELLAKLAAGGPTAAMMHREKVNKYHSNYNS